MNPTGKKWAMSVLILSMFSILALSSFSQQTNPLINSGELLKKGNALHDEGKMKEAIELYKKISRSDTNYADALYELGLSYYADSQFTKALEYAQTGILLFPERFSSYSINAANALDDLERSEEAIAMYDKAYAREPQSAVLLFNKGLTLYGLKRLDEAKAAFQKSVLVNPYYSSSHYYIGKIYLQEGNLVAAMLAYKTYLLLAAGGKYVSSIIADMSDIAKVSDEVQTYVKNRKKGADNFDFLQQILLSKIALDPKYKLMAPLEDNIVRQIQVVDEKLEYKKTDTGFAMQYYVPLYSKLFQEGDFEALIFTIFSGLKIDKMQSWHKKNKKKYEVLVDKVVEYLTEVKATQVLNRDDRKKTTKKFLYEDGSFLGIGEYTKNGDKTILSGPWEFYFSNGALKSKGFFGVDENKEGEWLYYYNNGQLKEKVSYKVGQRVGPSQGWFDNGVLWYTNNHVKDKAEGLQTGYFYSGLVRRETQYANDLKNGTEKEYSSRGYLLSVSNYVDDVQDGMETTYHSNGEKASEVAYKKGKASGTYKAYYENGALQSQCEFVDGQKQGLWTNYYKNGTIKEKTNYVNNEILGEFTEYYENGVLNRKGTYTKKDIDGKLESYDEDGKIYSDIVYDKGRIRELNFYDKKGNVVSNTTTRRGAANIVFYTPEGVKLSEGFFNKDGNKEGKFTEYFGDGKVKSVSNNKDGLLDGTFTQYFLTGQKSSEQEYKNNEEHGYYKGYHGNGKLSGEGWMQDGQKQQNFIFYNNLGDTTVKEYYLNGDQDGYTQYLRPNKSLEYEYRFENGWLKSIAQFDSTSKPLVTSEFKDGKGKYYLKHYNGNTWVDANYDYFMLNGLYKVFYFDGKPLSVTKFIKDERDSIYKEFSYEGKLRVEGKYARGKKVGEWKYYYSSGQLSEVENYKDGQLDGLDKFYNKDGTLDKELNYKEGSLDGYYKYFGEKNQLAVALLYTKGALKGYTYEDAAGKLVATIPLVNGTGKVTGSYANGTKSSELDFVDGFAHGTRKIYFSNGKLSVDGIRELGWDNGVKKVFYPSGSIYSEEFFTLGNLNGVRKFYFPSGKIESEEPFYNDELHGVIKYYDEAGKVKRTKTYYYGKLLSAN
jgi:antitoxin component YwqK of YwqJK toxin-antitoxin module/Tfp pilus assembly protein PilF